jgi:hypothetical protein
LDPLVGLSVNGHLLRRAGGLLQELKLGFALLLKDLIENSAFIANKFQNICETTQHLNLYVF